MVLHFDLRRLASVTLTRLHVQTERAFRVTTYATVTTTAQTAAMNSTAVSSTDLIHTQINAETQKYSIKSGYK